MSLDEKISKLTEIEEKLQDSNLPICQSVQLYEEGVKLAREILDELNQLKGKISVIKQDMDAYSEKITTKENLS